MHGSPRQHIWTFVAGAMQNYPYLSYYLCPCDARYIFGPRFVGEDYYCDSGYIFGEGEPLSFHGDNALWDGAGCHSSSTCCREEGLPYFTKTLPHSTADDLEVRLCNYKSSVYEEVAVESIELYVK